MKKILLVLVVIGFMGCVLDETYQEEQSKHITTQELNHPKSKVVTVYIDCEGNEITDPDIIKSIEMKR